jgi:hypothetical protein
MTRHEPATLHGTPGDHHVTTSSSTTTPDGWTGHLTDLTAALPD